MDSVTIGGSEIAAACGIDPHKSRVGLWAEKTGLIDPQPAGEAALWGTLLEPVVRAEVEARGYEIIPGPAVMTSTETPWLLGHPDGFANIDGTRGVYEGKTCGPFVKGWDDDGVPTAYVAQASTYMYLSDTPIALIACLVGGQRLELRTIPRDDELIALLLEAGQEFIGYCTRNEPPPPDGSDAATEVLKRLYPHAHAATAIELTADDMLVVGDLRRMKEARKETERQEAELEQKLKLKLGDAEYGVRDGQTVLRWQTIVQHRKASEARDIEFRRFSLGGT